MQTSTSVIGRPSKHSKLVNGLKQYLSDARSNPGLKLTVLAISRAIGVKKSTIYLHQDDPEVAELLNSVRALATARKLAALNSDESVNSETDEKSFQESNIGLTDDASELISLELLTVNSANAIQKAVWSMSRFIGRHRKHRYVSDLPRAVFDLDATLAQLYRIREELGSMSDKWIQISQSNCEIVSVSDQLTLSYASEEKF
jgi:dynactin complex subunit